MKNRQIDAAWAYHNGTKHSYQSVRANPHYLDFDNQPVSFQNLLRVRADPSTPASVLFRDAIPGRDFGGCRAAGSPSLLRNRQTLAEILFLGAGITRRRKYPGGEMLFRAAACTGALYHIDLYLVCAELQDIPSRSLPLQPP